MQSIVSSTRAAVRITVMGQQHKQCLHVEHHSLEHIFPWQRRNNPTMVITWLWLTCTTYELRRFSSRHNGSLPSSGVNSNSGTPCRKQHIGHVTPSHGIRRNGQRICYVPQKWKSYKIDHCFALKNTKAACFDLWVCRGPCITRVGDSATTAQQSSSA